MRGWFYDQPQATGWNLEANPAGRSIIGGWVGFVKIGDCRE